MCGAATNVAVETVQERAKVSRVHWNGQECEYYCVVCRGLKFGIVAVGCVKLCAAPFCVREVEGTLWISSACGEMGELLYAVYL